MTEPSEGRQDQLRELLEDIIQSEEQDSRRLALDLHDGLVQLMVASYQHLQAAQAWHKRNPILELKEFDQGVAILRQAISEARRLISELRPAGLDDFGLIHALRVYIAQVAADTGWETTLDISPNWSKLEPDLETTLFRIIQEAITNARKYAHTKRLAVSLIATGDLLQVTIRDWGQGFQPDEVLPEQAGQRIGLVGIRERARLWGGTCRIESELGKGTTIYIEIPHQTQPGSVEASE